MGNNSDFQKLGAAAFSLLQSTSQVKRVIHSCYESNIINKELGK